MHVRVKHVPRSMYGKFTDSSTKLNLFTLLVLTIGHSSITAWKMAKMLNRNKIGTQKRYIIEINSWQHSKLSLLTSVTCLNNGTLFLMHLSTASSCWNFTVHTSPCSHYTELLMKRALSVVELREISNFH